MSFWSHSANLERQPEAAGSPNALQQTISQSIRPGHLTDLSKFMTHTNLDGHDEGQREANRDLKGPSWELGHNVTLDPGSIIYIRDISAEARISDRIMFVLRKNTQSSWACLTFCSHPDTWSVTLHKTHVQVISKPPDSQRQ